MIKKIIKTISIVLWSLFILVEILYFWIRFDIYAMSDFVSYYKGNIYSPEMSESYYRGDIFEESNFEKARTNKTLEPIIFPISGINTIKTSFSLINQEQKQVEVKLPSLDKKIELSHGDTITFVYSDPGDHDITMPYTIGDYSGQMNVSFR